MDNNKISPELIKKINNDEIHSLCDTVNNNMVKGSPEERKYQMKLRLLKKLNEKEYIETQKYKRKSSRFN